LCEKYHINKISWKGKTLLKMNIEFREKLITTLYAASLFSLTLLFFGPSYLYFTNILEFPYLFSDVWYLFASVSLLSILVISAVLLPLKPSVHRKAVSLLFVLAVLLWIQGNILVWKYGVLDGKGIPWNNYKIYGFIDSAVWLLFLSFAFIKSKLVYNIIKKVSLVLILTQIVSLSITWFQAPEQPDWKKYVISNESKYTFSAEKNVIILVLDTFQTDIFQELINKNPIYKETFEGFTYFRNAIGGYPTTYPSIPLILTGQYYDNSIPIHEFIKNTYSNSSIPLILKQNGYQVDLFTGVNVIYASNDIFSNLVIRKGIVNIKSCIDEFYNITLFRYTPNFFKKYFYTINTAVDNKLRKEDLVFADQVISKSEAVKGKYSFKIFHLSGAHPPFCLNEKLEYEELEYSRNSYEIQSQAALEITKRFLTSLKNIGIYDNSMIFIVGDHGSGSFGVNVQASGCTEDNKVVNITSSNIIASGIPLILVKPFASTAGLKISDAPVSLSDIPKTIISELGLKDDLPGRSMFTINESDIRERRFLAYNWEHEYWNKAYLPAMQEYIVTGFSWLNQSWRPTYRRFTPNGVEDTQPIIYEYGSQIQFGDAGNAEQYQVQGWSSPEKGFTWTDGKNASLVIPVNQPQSDLILSASLIPFIAGEVINQNVIINVNGEKLGEWDIRVAGDFKITIPKEYITRSLLNVNFELPDAASPSELNIGNDMRTLGIAMQSIQVLEKN